MDSPIVIAVASIATAGMTIAIGSIGPAFAEGRAVATALTSLAQQPDASPTITRTLFVGLAMIESLAIYCFVVSMILIFANPFWKEVIAHAGGQIAMLIDWFTVGAQVLNFLILVWLLQHFLYKPILAAIDAREKRIADQLADAAVKQADAQKEHDEFDGKNKAIDEQRNALFTKATAEAKTERDRLLGEAKKEADTLRTEQAAALNSDNARLSKEVTRMAANEVFGIARKALSDLSTVSLEERIAVVFTRRLHEMDAQAKATMGAAIKASNDPALVRSTFDQPADQKAAIQNAINETFASDVRIRYETAPDGVCGIELTAGGQKIAWTIAKYLDALDGKVGELLNAQPAPEAK